MKFLPNKENVEKLREATNLLIQLINVVGQRATSKEFTEKALLRHCLMDLLKKTNANLNGFSILLSHFGEPENDLFKIPLSLCLRGAVSDCFTGIYLYSLSDDAKSLENEVNLMSIDYAKYLKDAEEFSLRYGDRLNELEINDALEKWKIEFKKDKPFIFKSKDDAKWEFKKINEIRKDSKYNPGNGGTERGKFEWLKLVDTDSDYILLYILFRCLSQYQHYSFASRQLIDGIHNEDFKKFVSGITLITQSCWVFFNALDQVSNDIDELYSQIIKKLNYFLE